MGRSTRALTACGALVALAHGCGDPIIVTGDQPAVMRIVAGIGDSIGTRVDTLATRTRLTEPAAVTFDEANHTLWVADRGALAQSQGITRRVARLFAIRSNGRIELVIDRGGCAGTICIESPFAIAVGTDGALLITDEIGNRIFRLSGPRGPLDVIAGDGTRGETPDGRPARNARIAAPAGIAVAPEGRIYFAERAGHRIRVIEPDGTLGTVAGIGAPGYAGDGQPAAAARLSGPAGITLSAGTLYIADAENHRVRAVDLASRIIATVAGSGIAGFTGDDARALEARLDRPLHVTLAVDGNSLFVSDFGNDRVRVVDARSGVIRTFAGNGDRGYTPPGRPAGATALLRPAALFASSSGLLFIADAGHSVVWRTALR